MPVQTSAVITVEAPLAAVFSTAASIDARELIQPQGILPGIEDVEGHDAPWSAIGEVRRHTLSDGASVREELISFARDSHFAYRVTDFTGAFAPIVSHAKGEWHFTQLGAEKTQIDWTYSFTPTGPIAEPVVWFIVKLFWPGYLKAALSRVKNKCENENRHL